MSALVCLLIDRAAKLNVMFTRKQWLIVGAVLVAAAGFRIAVAHWLPNDAPGDSVVYSQLARNVIEQHVYSHEPQAPYAPALIRMPGYPLFLAGVYAVFGHTNNGAVRIVQALIDTATCGLVALLAFYWQPDQKKKRASALAALALAALCPFTTIYAATILTEVPTNFLMMAMFVAVTIAFRKLTAEGTGNNSKGNLKGAILWWFIAGLIGGVAVMMRPDSGLFLAAVGLTLVINIVWSLVARVRRRSKAKNQTLTLKTNGFRALLSAAIFSLAFIFVIAPWTIRNRRVFHVFQPLSPAHGEMPGEFVPRGYNLWVRTWIDDQSYIAPFLWSLDTEPIDVDDAPSYAFDSPEEKKRVATLFEAYNNEADDELGNAAQSAPQASPSPTPPNEENESEEESGNQPENAQTQDQPAVQMTPEIDAAFGQLARERIARHRFQFYVVLPLKRARTMWFDTHSQYWPFDGTLLPLEDLDYSTHQQIWLPLFAALTGVYTLLGLAGAWLLWVSENSAARRWLLLVVLAIALRLMLFSWIENPEPRYVVEFFPLLSVLGGIAIAQIPKALRTRQTNADERG